jgi:hypothetical protein
MQFKKLAATRLGLVITIPFGRVCMVLHIWFIRTDGMQVIGAENVRLSYGMNFSDLRDFRLTNDY